MKNILHTVVDQNDNVFHIVTGTHEYGSTILTYAAHTVTVQGYSAILIDDKEGFDTMENRTEDETARSMAFLSMYENWRVETRRDEAVV